MHTWAVTPRRGGNRASTKVKKKCTPSHDVTDGGGVVLGGGEGNLRLNYPLRDSVQHGSRNLCESFAFERMHECRSSCRSSIVGEDFQSQGERCGSRRYCMHRSNCGRPGRADDPTCSPLSIWTIEQRIPARTTEPIWDTPLR